MTETEIIVWVACGVIVILCLIGGYRQTKFEQSHKKPIK